jgi:hypothetical protein
VKVVTYKPKEIFWIVRCNFVIFKDLNYNEITLGLFGYGVLIYWKRKKYD